MFYEIVIPLVLTRFMGVNIADQPERCFRSRPIPVGTCENIMYGFFYNQESGRCEQWIEKGCEAVNGNSYRTLEDCNNDCLAHFDCSKPPDRCLEPQAKAVGNCDTPVTGYFFNPEVGLCYQFSERGCGTIGRNTFVTISECKRDCIRPCSAVDQ